MIIQVCLGPSHRRPIGVSSRADQRLLYHQYCCLLASVGEEPEVATDILEHIVFANVFRSNQRQQAIRVTTLGPCLLYLYLSDTFLLGRLSANHRISRCLVCFQPARWPLGM